ncbi:MAG: cytochrome c [Rhodospirillaceae bacterium]|nr:cytochrome c [Rhodospirillaceae bacterium]
MKRRLLGAVMIVGVAVASGLFLASAPRHIDSASLPPHVGDVANGEVLYHIGGCIACHHPAKESGADMALPSGGAAFVTPIGTLYPPNLTPDTETGLGGWSDAAFIDAVRHGVSPRGDHYIPAFPYVSYGRMKVEDILDIRAYLKTLPAISSVAKPAEIPFPWLVRRGLGLWKRLAVLPPLTDDPGQSASWNRGAYLVNGPGHCAECHTPRNLAMVMDVDQALAGGPHPEGRGKVPSLRDLIGRQKYKDVDELATALKEGEEGYFEDLASGGMAEVQQNIARLPDTDVHAIAEYLGSLK